MKSVYLILCTLVCFGMSAQSTLDSSETSCLATFEPSEEDSSFNHVSIHFSEQHGGCIPMTPEHVLSVDILLFKNNSTWVYVRQGDSIMRYKLPVNAGPPLCTWYLDLISDTVFCGGFSGGIPVFVQIKAEGSAKGWRYCKGGLRNHKEILLNLISELAAVRKRYR